MILHFLLQWHQSCACQQIYCICNRSIAHAKGIDTKSIALVMCQSIDLLHMQQNTSIAHAIPMDCQYIFFVVEANLHHFSAVFRPFFAFFSTFSDYVAVILFLHLIFKILLYNSTPFLGMSEHIFKPFFAIFGHFDTKEKKKIF